MRVDLDDFLDFGVSAKCQPEIRDYDVFDSDVEDNVEARVNFII